MSQRVGPSLDSWVDRGLFQAQSKALTGPSLIRNRAGYRVTDVLDVQVAIEFPAEGKAEDRIEEDS